jgi:hypothetical protein
VSAPLKLTFRLHKPRCSIESSPEHANNARRLLPQGEFGDAPHNMLDFV